MSTTETARSRAKEAKDKEAQAFWEKVYLSVVPIPNQTTDDAAAIADIALAAWEDRFDPPKKRQV